MAARLPKAFVSWSSGKDSAYALLEARRQSIAETVGIITTINTTDDRVAIHGVRQALLTRQATALGLPVIRVELPYPCPNETYEARFLEACVRIKAQGAEHIVFGDLFLEDIRTYREGVLARAGMQGLFPLWRRDTRSLAHDMIASGIVAHLVCVDLQRLNRSYAGRPFDSGFLSGLPCGVDPCGENGEFHTLRRTAVHGAHPRACRGNRRARRVRLCRCHSELSCALDQVKSRRRRPLLDSPGFSFEIPVRRCSKQFVCSRIPTSGGPCRLRSRRGRAHRPGD